MNFRQIIGIVFILLAIIMINSSDKKMVKKEGKAENAYHEKTL